MGTTRQRWFERYTLNQTVEVLTIRGGKEVWSLGVVRELPRRPTLRPSAAPVGFFRVTRTETRDEIEVHQAKSVRVPS